MEELVSDSAARTIRNIPQSHTDLHEDQDDKRIERDTEDVHDGSARLFRYILGPKCSYPQVCRCVV